MDPTYLKTLHDLLLQSTSNDTAILRAATAQLDREYYQSPVCISGLVSILSGSSEESVRQLAAVELRKRVSSFWIQLPVEERQQVKEKLPEIILIEQHQLVRYSTARVIEAIASIEVPEYTWPALLPFLQQTCASHQVLQREIGSFVLFTVLKTIVEASREDLTHTFDLFRGLLVDPESLQVRITSFRALAIIVKYLNNEDNYEVKTFQKLVPSMLQVIGQVVEAGDEAGARNLFYVLPGLLVRETPILSKHIPELINFLLQTGANRRFHNELRVLSLNALKWTVEYKSSKIQNKKLACSILEGLMPITTEDEAEDDQIPSQSALAVIDCLATTLPPTQIFPVLHALIVQYFSSQEPANRRGALFVLGICAEGCKEHMTPLMDSDFWPIVEAGFVDSNATVRRAACTTVSCLCQWLDDTCASNHAVLVPSIMNLINDSETQKSACTTLDALLQTLHDDIEQYLQLIMERLAVLLENSPISIKAVVIGAIGSAARTSKQDFLPYFQPAINHMVRLLTLTDEGEEIELRGQAMEAVGTFAEAVGEDAFRPYFPEMMKHAFSGMEVGNATLRESSFLFFGTMARVFGEDFTPYLPQVVPLLLTSCKQLEQGDIASDVLAEDDATKFPDVDALHLLTGINAPVAKEKAIAADTIGTLFAATQIHFLPFIEPCAFALVDLVSHDYVNARKNAIDSLLGMIRIFYDLSDHEPWVPGVNASPPLNDQIQELIKPALDAMLQLFNTEDSKFLLACLCNGLAETIRKVGPRMLINHLEDICTMALLILKQKAYCQQDPAQEDGEEAEDQAVSDSVLISSACDLVGDLAFILGPSFSQLFNIFFPSISTYYKPNRTETERSAAIGCLAAVVDGIKGAISPHTQSLLQLFYHALSDTEDTVLSNSAFATGLLVEFSEEDLSQEYLHILKVLRPLFVVQPDDSDEKLIAKDNATGAVARLILRNTAAVPLNKVLPTFIDALPLEKDYDENRSVFRALFHLFKTNGRVLYPFLDRLLPVFRHVLTPSGEEDSSEEEQIDQDIRSELIHLIGLINKEVPDKVQAANLGMYIET